MIQLLNMKDMYLLSTYFFFLTYENIEHLLRWEDKLNKNLTSLCQIGANSHSLLLHQLLPFLSNHNAIVKMKIPINQP